MGKGMRAGKKPGGGGAGNMQKHLCRCSKCREKWKKCRLNWKRGKWKPLQAEAP